MVHEVEIELDESVLWRVDAMVRQIKESELGMVPDPTGSSDSVRGMVIHRLLNEATMDQAIALAGTNGVVPIGPDANVTRRFSVELPPDTYTKLLVLTRGVESANAVEEVSMQALRGEALRLAITVDRSFNELIPLAPVATDFDESPSP